METRTCLANVARQLNRATASAAERMELGTADVKEIKELAGLLQALVGLEKAMEPPEKKQSKAAAVRATVHDEISTACPATVLRRVPEATLYLDDESAGQLS